MPPATWCFQAGDRDSGDGVLRLGDRLSSSGQNKVNSAELVLRVIDSPKVYNAVLLLRDTCGYDHVTYHMAFRTNTPSDLPYIQSTYSMDWMIHYMQNQFINIDPVLANGFSRSKPFFWSDLDEDNTKAQKSFFEDAAKYGIGPSGYTIPLSDRHQRRANFTVTSTMDEADWRAKITGEAELLEQIAGILHRKALEEVYGDDSGPVLAPRELECLNWTAQGKDSATVAIILGISEHTVRDYLKAARHKLGCSNITQAVHEATKRRLIDY